MMSKAGPAVSENSDFLRDTLETQPWTFRTFAGVTPDRFIDETVAKQHWAKHIE
jgi:hypothetical protein